MRSLRFLVPILVAGCSVTPLTGKIAPGDEAFVIVVGEGPDGDTDLFAAPAGNGAFYRLTFSRPAEQSPKLAADGTRVAFIRRYQDGKAELAVLDLTTMGEVRVPLQAATADTRLGWSTSGDSVVIAEGGILSVVALGDGTPSLSPVGAADSARVDSLSHERLGDPVFALVERCGQSVGWCAVAANGETALGADAVDPFRWGADALGYLRSGRVEVRPLGGGGTHFVDWKNPPKNLRQPTYHPGEAAR